MRTFKMNVHHYTAYFINKELIYQILILMAPNL